MKHHPILSVKARRINKIFKYYNLTKYHRRMKKIYNSHLGESCFVIGNGPSLTADDLNTLIDNNIDSFAANRIYKIFPQTKWRPTYYVNSDWSLIRDVLEEVNLIPAKIRFFPVHHLYQKSFRKTIGNKTVFNMKYSEDTAFRLDCTDSIKGVGTVTIEAIQLAAHMGYRNIYLLGVDHNFDNIIDKSGKTVVNKDVKNYFVDDYDTDISNKVVHNLGNTTRKYYEAQKFYAEHGVNIYNSTRTTKLEAFPKTAFENAVKSITEH